MQTKNIATNTVASLENNYRAEIIRRVEALKDYRKLRLILIFILNLF